MTITAVALRPIALQPDEGEALWFMGMLATIKASNEGTGGKVAVIEHTSPHNSGSPLHVHHREDEWFYVLEGELTIWVDGQVIRAPAGSFVFGPQDTPAHLYRVLTGGSPLLAGNRAGWFRALHALRCRAGQGPYLAAASERTPRYGTTGRPCRRIWHRDPWPARHSVLTVESPAPLAQIGHVTRSVIRPGPLDA